tara:strand:+ start:642 stop:824 length:183 start_codon:yes stop_codon:yes gene_type:complete
MYNNQPDYEDYQNIKIKEYGEFFHEGKTYFKATNGEIIWVFDKNLNEIGIYHNEKHIEFY